jgi:hypothetical protein
VIWRALPLLPWALFLLSDAPCIPSASLVAPCAPSFSFSISSAACTRRASCSCSSASSSPFFSVAPSRTITRFDNVVDGEVGSPFEKKTGNSWVVALFAKGKLVYAGNDGFGNGWLSPVASRNAFPSFEGKEAAAAL